MPHIICSTNTKLEYNMVRFPSRQSLRREISNIYQQYSIHSISVTLPSRIEYITTNVEKIKTSRLESDIFESLLKIISECDSERTKLLILKRLSVSMERITELFSLTISKGKLELMDNSSEMTRSLSRLFYHEVDYNHIFDENLSNNEKGNGFIKKMFV